MNDINKHGLSRKIPSDVKRAVRQRCGFGCVICGEGVIDYEHVDPEFSEALSHEAKNIALLCPRHHTKITRKIWSKEKVKKAMADPFCKRQGFSNDFFDFCDRSPVLKFGGVSLKKCPVPIMVGDVPLFKVEKPEATGAPFRLSGTFVDSNGNQSFSIVKNEWMASASNWDVETVGRAITVREGPGNIHLRLVVDLPNTLIVDRLKMSLDGYRFEANSEMLTVTLRDGTSVSFTGLISDGARTAGLFLP